MNYHISENGMKILDYQVINSLRIGSKIYHFNVSLFFSLCFGRGFYNGVNTLVFKYRLHELRESIEEINALRSYMIISKYPTNETLAIGIADTQLDAFFRLKENMELQIVSCMYFSLEERLKSNRKRIFDYIRLVDEK